MTDENSVREKISDEEKSVHEKIKLVRQAKGLTQEEVASWLGMSAIQGLNGS